MRVYGLSNALKALSRLFVVLKRGQNFRSKSLAVKKANSYPVTAGSRQRTCLFKQEATRRRAQSRCRRAAGAADPPG